MDKKAVLRIVGQYADAVKRNLPVEKVVLYGSHARGTAREDSDIYVAVVIKSLSGDYDYLHTATMLFRLTRDIDLRIEPLLLEEENDSSGFLKEVLTRGELVYSRS